MNEPTVYQVGSVEILKARTYPLDMESPEPVSEAVVFPGTFPLYQVNDTVMWIMTGKLIFVGRGVQRVGDGTMVAGDSDNPVDIEVQFPSRRYGPKQFHELRKHPIAQEGHRDQRLRITLASPKEV